MTTDQTYGVARQMLTATAVTVFDAPAQTWRVRLDYEGPFVAGEDGEPASWGSYPEADRAAQQMNRKATAGSRS